jgi:dolichol-phosphate mannosyltransferase
MILTNVLGTSVLLDAAVGRGFDAFVYAGSSSEYGIKDHAPNEDESLSPNSDYAVTKAAATMLCANVGRTLGLNVATLRLYSVYGPWEEPTRFVPALAVYGLAGRLPPLASPTTARDFVYIDDVVEAFLAAATVRSPDPGGIYNIGAGKQVTLGEAVDAAKRLLRIQATPDWGGHAGRSWDASVWVSNPTRAYRILGWKAMRSFESGLAAFVDWLQADEIRLRRYRAAVATDEASGQA